MEQEECCILGICCDPQLRRAALAEKLYNDVNRPHRNVGLTIEQAQAVADFLLDTYDLAPHGKLMPLVDYIAAEAREYPYRQS